MTTPTLPTHRPPLYSDSSTFCDGLQTNGAQPLINSNCDDYSDAFNESTVEHEVTLFLPSVAFRNSDTSFVTSVPSLLVSFHDLIDLSFQSVVLRGNALPYAVHLIQSSQPKPRLEQTQLIP